MTLHRIRLQTLRCAVLTMVLASGAIAAEPSKPDPRLLRTYCVTCHNGRLRTAGLNLDDADLANIPSDAPLWEKVARKLRAGAMPPSGMPRPARSELDAFAANVESILDQAAKPLPGKPVLRRLNRNEYAAAVRDLLAFHVDVSAMLPPDDANFGFDNIADSLRVSPVLVEAYLSASRKVSHAAIGDPEIAPGFTVYPVKPDLGQDRHIDGLPLGTRGGALAKHYFPLDGEYVFKTKLAVNTSAKVRGLDFPHEFILTIDGKQVHHAVLGGEADEDAAAASPPESEAQILARLEARVSIAAGPHEVGAAFIRKTGARDDGLLQPFLRSNFDTQEQRGIPFVESLSIGGPFAAKGPGDTPARKRIFVCRPRRAAEELACANKVLSAIMRRAYRRPVNPADLAPALQLFESGSKAASTGDRFEAGIKAGLRLILSSPEFLFRAESDPPNLAAGSSHPVTGLELASRLSFFLWSSIPDDELLGLAAAGKLSDSATVEKQVRRMIADSRSKALVDNFASQWLFLRNLDGVTRDLETFPNFDDNLRKGFRQETELFVESILREDRSILDFLGADYTFLNERLAVHYGIPNVKGSYFRRVTLAADSRRGLLGQGSILTVTSYATRTSPVLRGKWLLENILGTPVPPPPPNVPPLEENRAGMKPRSVRERMEEHRKNPACSVCHNIMDPAGFALDNFDAVGAWRDKAESRLPVDASGVLVDGTRVDGPVTLRAALLARPDAFARTFTEKLLTYALGRGLESTDMPVVRSILRDAAKDNYRFSSIILGIVKSVPFQMKQKDLPETRAYAIHH